MPAMTLRPSTWLVAAAFTLVTSAASAEPPTPPHRPPLRLILTPPRVSQSASHRAASSGWPASDPDPWWGPDKALHFSLAALLAGGGYALGAIVTDDPVGRAALGADLALSAALFKEAADEAGLGTPSWRDFTWSVLGTALGISVSVAIDLAAPKSTPSPAR
jgi:uncharacterized protein YfiM (DUF2279 family)